MVSCDFLEVTLMPEGSQKELVAMSYEEGRWTMLLLLLV